MHYYLYAGDIVSFGNSARDIQLVLDSMHKCCKDWTVMGNPSLIQNIMKWSNKTMTITSTLGTNYAHTFVHVHNFHDCNS